MFRQSSMFRFGMLGLGIVPALALLGRAQPPPKVGAAPDGVSVQAGVDVLTRGPVHEAFAALAIRAPRSSPIIPKQPPQPIEELAPDQKPEGDNTQWIPGYWAWNDDSSDFLWVSGTFRIVPPGRHWVPGYFNQADGGWQWIAGFWDDHQKNDVDLLPAPPDPVDEAVPPAPSEPSIYQPGCWVYHGDRYMWRNGFYTPYRENWTWTPASYYWTPGGYIFNDGYWDYPWHRRGLLFAPVSFSGSLWLQTGWSYRPSYLVNDGFLLASLFERPSHHHYYFGDYYGSRYDGMGFVPWTDARYGRNIGDPLFAYYQLQNRDNPAWSRDLRQLYATRRVDVAARPPRTLVQQKRVIQNINNKTIITNNVTNITNVTALASLAQVDGTRVKLQPVSRVQHVEVQKTSAQFRDFSAQRGKLEAQAKVKAQTPAPPGESPKPIKVDLPANRPAPVKAFDGPKANLPPARPVMPEPQPVHPGTGRPLDVPKSGSAPLPAIKPEAPVTSAPKPAPSPVPPPAAKPPAPAPPAPKPPAPAPPPPGKPPVSDPKKDQS